MSRLAIGAWMGAATMAALLILRMRISSFLAGDTFLLLLVVLVAAIGATLGGALILAWDHVVHAPALLLRVGLIVLPFSLPLFWSFVSEWRAVPETLARADSTYGQVLGRNLVGRLVVVARFPDRTGRFIAPRKLAQNKLRSGDSITVYYERQAPHRILDVSPPGPDGWVFAARLLGFWFLLGILVAGYGPRLSKWLAEPLRA